MLNSYSLLCIVLVVYFVNCIGVKGGPSYSYPFRAPITLGSDGSPQIVTFDTGASQLWVASTRCNDSECLRHTRYDHLNSNTYQSLNQLAKIDFGDMGLVRGQVARDQLRLSGVTVQNQTFVEAFNLPDQEVLPLGVDGIIGMDLSSFHDNAAYKNPLKLMVEQGLVEEKMFSLSSDLGVGPYQGTIVLGSPRRDLFENFLMYFPVTHPDRWQFRLSGISMNNDRTILNILGSRLIYRLPRVSVCGDGCDVVASTGMPVILGPQNEVRRLNANLGARRMDDGSYVLPSCELTSLPNLVLEKGPNSELSISPKQYVVQMGPNRCLSGIFEGSESFWVLGQNVLRSFYTEFDYGKRLIGFARGTQPN